jgi:hypothetical protein
MQRRPGDIVCRRLELTGGLGASGRDAEMAGMQMAEIRQAAEFSTSEIARRLPAPRLILGCSENFAWT